ncbi:MAG: hypothetical protein ACRDGJ_08115, partial [Candidatus Limnocylindria bacterium]
MTDEPFRLDPSEGQHVPTSPAERVVVGFAALALLSGVVIAFGNMLGSDGEAGAASTSATPAASVRATRAPRPTATPRPLREFWLQPVDPEPIPPEELYGFNGFIRPLEDLVVRREPQAEAPEVGILPAGQVAMADELTDMTGGAGWLRISAPSPQGWVATVRDGSPLVESFTPQTGPVSADVWGMSAGDDGFVAYGWSPAVSTSGLHGMTAASRDGLSWESSLAPGQYREIWTAAWGPAGWLTVSWVEPGRLWVSQSSDGLTWSVLGAMEDLPNRAYPSLLVGSARGYLMATPDVYGSGGGQVFWFSADGVTWNESRVAELDGYAQIRLAAGTNGFYVWDERPVDSQSRARGAFSADGRTWSAVTYGPEGLSTQVVPLGDGWLAVDADPGSDGARVWIGMVTGERLTWRRDRNAQAAFSGAAVSALASDGQRPVAFGWERSTERPLVWTVRDGEWTRSRLPSAFGGIPRWAAGGPSGFVVVGSRPTLRGSNPIFWHSTDGRSWTPEPSPVFALAADPTADDCGPSPDDALDLLLIDRAAAVVCFGGEPLTLRAWSAPCDGCYGGPPGVAQPQWLAGPTDNQVFLSPIESFDGWWTNVVLH